MLQAGLSVSLAVASRPQRVSGYWRLAWEDPHRSTKFRRMHLFFCFKINMLNVVLQGGDKGGSPWPHGRIPIGSSVDVIDASVARLLAALIGA